MIQGDNMSVHSNKVPTKVLTAHLPIKLIDTVDEFAERLERSRVWILKQALSDWIAKEQEHHRLTLEGLDDVKTGQTMDHKEIKAWVNSLATKKIKGRP